MWKISPVLSLENSVVSTKCSLQSMQPFSHLKLPGKLVSSLTGRIEGMRMSFKDLQFRSPTTGTLGTALHIVSSSNSIECCSDKIFRKGGLRGLCVIIKGTLECFDLFV